VPIPWPSLPDNFVDTADIYGGGASEELVGRLIAERGARARTVLSTKVALGVHPGDPNEAGNGRKAMLRSPPPSANPVHSRVWCARVAVKTPIWGRITAMRTHETAPAVATRLVGPMTMARGRGRA
jgi:hypothetical protein